MTFLHPYYNRFLENTSKEVHLKKYAHEKGKFNAKKIRMGERLGKVKTNYCPFKCN